MNKSDTAEPSILEGLCQRFEAVAVSALKREGLDRLMAAAESLIH
jgi:50S ribosomal subunit-associated GTPase HflX